MNQDGEATSAASAPNTAWGPMRIVYLQYASDPVTFFEYRSLYREPHWMPPAARPGRVATNAVVSVVTLLQLAVDKFMATSAPIGHGHVCAPAHYIEAWIQVTDVRDWSPEEITRLQQHLSKP